MENPDTTISKNILENLWPLILENNECEIRSANMSEYFVPDRHFDHLWAHEFLAKKCYEDYEPAIELKCKTTEESATATKTEEEIEQEPYRGPQANILPLDQQLALIKQDVEIRKKLASDFANRKFPWYIQRGPIPQQPFKITPEIEQLFKDKFELEILRTIQKINCNLMIIDVAPDISFKYMERWFKFAPYATIILVIHNMDLYKKIQNFNNIVQSVLHDEQPLSTWQEELERSLDVGINKAKELYLSEEICKPLVFLFSQNRGICICDQFKILRRS